MLVIFICTLLNLGIFVYVDCDFFVLDLLIGTVVRHTMINHCDRPITHES